MNVHVTLSTERDALTFSCYHDFHPERFLPFSLLVQVCQFAYMVHFYTLFASACFTGVFEQSFDYLCSLVYVWEYDLIFDGGFLPTLERYPTAGAYQRLLSFARDG